jgi:hypothetical protein
VHLWISDGGGGGAGSSDRVALMMEVKLKYGGYGIVMIEVKEQ